MKRKKVKMQRSRARSNGRARKQSANGRRKRNRFPEQSAIVVASSVVVEPRPPKEPNVVDLRTPIQTLDERALAIREMLKRDPGFAAEFDSAAAHLPAHARDRLVRYLNEAWATEKQLIDSLQEMLDSIDDAELQSLLRNHHSTTDRQRLDLEDELRRFGIEPSDGRGVFHQIISWIGELFRSKPIDEGDRTLQTVLKAYAIEHLEMAMYEALYVCAQLINEEGIANLAAHHLEEERDTAAQIRPFIHTAASRAMAMPEKES